MILVLPLGKALWTPPRPGLVTTRETTAADFKPGVLTGNGGETLKAWNHFTNMTPDELGQHLIGTGHDLTAEPDYVAGGHRGENSNKILTVHYNLMKPGVPHPVGTIKRSFSDPAPHVVFPGLGGLQDSPQPKTVEHRHFELYRPTEQGKGVGRAALKSSINLYQNMGMDNVHTHASLDNGGYTWAKFGFKPENNEEWQDTVRTRRQNMRDETIPPEHRKIVDAALQSDDPKAIWHIADLPVTPGYDHLGRLGTRLLKGTDWTGNLNLHDPESMNRFHQYVNSPVKPL